jgi:hypothetical protein
MKKTTLLIGGVLVGSLLFTGCSAGNSYTRPAPEDSYVAPAPEPEPVVTDEDLYVMALRSHNNYIIDSSSDADLLDVGYTVCQVLADGYTFEEIAYAIVMDSPDESDAYYEFAGLVVGTASSSLCPQYSTT